MEKKELIQLLNNVLEPEGFKRKGNFWLINRTDITIMINIQKSQYGNFFYLNYGYIINSIPLDGLMMHVYNRLSSSVREEATRIDFLLDLDSVIPNEEREAELKKMIDEKLVTEIKEIKTEEDILINLKKRPHIHNIPLVVKNHFSLPIE